MIPDSVPVSFRTHRGSVTALAFSHEADTLITGGSDKSVRFWHVGRWSCIGELSGHGAGITDICVNRADTRLVSASRDGSATVWSFPEGAQLRELSGHRRAVTSVDISGDSKYIATTGFDDTVRLWSLESGEELDAVPGNARRLSSARFVPQRDILVTAGFGGMVGVWSVPELTVERSIDTHDTVAFPPRVSADGEHVLCYGLEHRMLYWSTRTWSVDREIGIPCGGGGAVALSPYDGSIAIVCGKELHLLDRDGTRLCKLELPTSRVRRACFSPDGEWLALAAQRGAVLLYSVVTP